MKEKYSRRLHQESGRRRKKKTYNVGKKRSTRIRNANISSRSWQVHGDTVAGVRLGTLRMNPDVETIRNFEVRLSGMLRRNAGRRVYVRAINLNTRNLNRDRRNHVEIFNRLSTIPDAHDGMVLTISLHNLEELRNI